MQNLGGKQSVLWAIGKWSIALARKQYRIWLLFTCENGGLGAISMTERRCAAPISRVERRI